jgi:hypothetical protein
MEAAGLHIVTRATQIFFMAIFGFAGCARDVKSARLHYAEPPTPAEKEARSRMAPPRCSPYWGYLFPGLGQMCARLDGRAVFLSSVMAAEVSGAIYVATEDNDPAVNVLATAAQDTYVYSLADGFIQRHLANRALYAPPDTLGDLIAAPFNWKVMKRPRVWAGILAATAIGFGLSYALTDADEIDRGGRPNLFGHDFDPVIGYPLGFGTQLGLYSHVAIAEETLFRGLLQSRWSAAWGETAGWLSASAVFGAAHIPNAWALDEEDRKSYYIFALPYITLLGLYFGWTYKEEGYTLAPSVAQHFWYDFLISASFFVLDPEDNQFSATITLPF